jgi:hypothetical protein
MKRCVAYVLGLLRQGRARNVDRRRALRALCFAADGSRPGASAACLTRSRPGVAVSPKPVPRVSASRRTRGLSEFLRASARCFPIAPASLNVSKKPRSLTATKSPAPVAPRCRVSISESVSASVATLAPFSVVATPSPWRPALIPSIPGERVVRFAGRGVSARRLDPVSGDRAGTGEAWAADPPNRDGPGARWSCEQPPRTS